MQLVEIKRAPSPVSLSSVPLETQAANLFPENKYPAWCRERWVKAVTFLREETKGGWMLERKLLKKKMLWDFLKPFLMMV